MSERAAHKKQTQEKYIWANRQLNHDTKTCENCYRIKYCGCVEICNGCQKHIANCNTSLCKRCKR